MGVKEESYEGRSSLTPLIAAGRSLHPRFQLGFERHHLPDVGEGLGHCNGEDRPQPFGVWGAVGRLSQVQGRRGAARGPSFTSPCRRLLSLHPPALQGLCGQDSGAFATIEELPCHEQGACASGGVRRVERGGSGPGGGGGSVGGHGSQFEDVEAAVVVREDSAAPGLCLWRRGMSVNIVLLQNQNIKHFLGSHTQLQTQTYTLLHK